MNVILRTQGNEWLQKLGEVYRNEIKIRFSCVILNDEWYFDLCSLDCVHLNSTSLKGGIKQLTLAISKYLHCKFGFKEIVLATENDCLHYTLTSSDLLTLFGSLLPSSSFRILFSDMSRGSGCPASHLLLIRTHKSKRIGWVEKGEKEEEEKQRWRLSLKHAGDVHSLFKRDIWGWFTLKL